MKNKDWRWSACVPAYLA